MRVSRLQIKALLLLLVVGITPVMVGMAVLLPGYGQAVRLTEQQSQLVMLREAMAAIEQHIAEPQMDAVAIAAALAQASSPNRRGSEGDGLTAVRAVLVSRPHIDAVRFEVPEAGVSTVLHKHGAEPQGVPASTPALRRQADEHGAAFQVIQGGRGVVVVPIPPPEGATGQPAKGYVSAPVYLSPLNDELRAIADSHHRVDTATGMLIVDAERQVVASYNAPRHEPGSDVSQLPIWAMLPAGIPRIQPVGAQDDYEQGGVMMVGSVQTVRTIGWALALWRPEASVLVEYHRIQRLAAAIGLGAILFALLFGLVAARAITRPVLAMTEQARRIGQRAWDRLRPASGRKDELGELDSALRQMAQDLREGEVELERQAKLRGDLSRFMSRELVEAIVTGDHSVELGGKRQSVTVLFADVVAFTPLAEGRRPEQVVGMLNELFSVLTEVVFRHEGMVDKFIGDCIMGVWGAPVACDEHAGRALAAAEDMMRFLEVGAAQWRDKYDVEVRLAIGINSGDTIVGNIGSDKRMEYTVVGDTVNVAARLETIAAPNQVLVGEATAELVADEFDLQLLGKRKLTGRTAEIEVYELETG